MRQRRPRQKDNGHLDFIRSLECIICRDNTSVEAAHVRMGEPKAAKRATGMSEKPDDMWTIPLCSKHHRLQHSMSEQSFWFCEMDIAINPIWLALALHSVSGDHEAGMTIIGAYH